ncbi:hypothetical protein L2E82_47453 [Cichorium intybus]|uniref:Uncharacterized protein n=1 Tax=Cichorium intybus TaxID=13427 RepID=A0ACB8YVT9_CICIN|nr:hypothetical protein L2E82_47453 [Cichorium intybus]
MTTATATASIRRNNSPPLTPDDIIRLAQYHTTAPLHPYLLSPTSHDTLVSHLHTLPPPAVSEYTSSLLSLLSPSPSLSTLLGSLLNSYIILFTSNKIPHDRRSLKTLELFSPHLENIPIAELQLISDTIVSSISQIDRDPDEAQLLDLLPKCLHIIFNSNEIDKPQDSVDAVFDRILDCNWSRILLVKLVSIIHEFKFVGKGRGKQFAQKVFDNMHCVELQDLPSLVYQLLVLASKGFNKREIIEGIVMFFGTKMHSKKASSNISREVEGTVLLHVNFAVKQDPSLGQEIMGLVRSNLQAIDHFVVGLLLSIARIRRYRENSMGTLKTALITAYKDYKFSRHCKWLPGSLKEEYLQNAILTEKALMRIVNESNHGREHIVPSIVQLGFLLLESMEEMSYKELGNTGLMGSQELGIQMLKSLFEVHDMARNEIIEQCKFRILSLKPEQSLTIIRLLESSSQASSSQQPQTPRGIVNDLFKELSSLLQRCLYQQAKVKEVVYQGLVKLVLVDPLTSEEVFDFLWPHFLQFYKEDGQLNIPHCIKTENNKVCIVEPLDDLLSCVSWILSLQPHQKSDSWASFGFSLTQDNETGGTVSGELFSNALSTIRKLLRNGYSEGQEGETYKYNAQIMLGVIEVILNTLATELEKASDEKKIDLEKEIFDLVDVYESLEKHTCTQSNGTSKGVIRSTGTDLTYKNESENTKSCKERATFLSTSSIHRLFQTFFENQHSKVLYFVLNTAFCKIKSFSHVAKDDPLKGLMYGDVKVLGPPLMKVIWLFMQGDQKKKEAKGKKEEEDKKGIVFIALMSLKELLTICSQSTEEMGEIEDMLLDENASSDHNIQREELLITKIVKPLFSRLLQAKFFHEIEVLCDIAKIIGGNLVGAWAISICETSNISNTKIARSLVSLALSCTQAPNDLVLAQDLVKTTGSETYRIINQSTETVISSVILHFLESVLVDMDRISMKLKTCFTNAYKGTTVDDDDDDNGEHKSYLTLEETLYNRIEAVMELLSSFVVMNLKDPQGEHVVRLAAKFYKNLARVSKFLIAPKGCKQILPNLKFQKLVEVTCKQLTGPLYTFVDAMQQKQQETRASKGILNKIKRENRCIPDLIFQIEDYEKYLILLSKACKFNLLRHAKRSTVRDFRIIDPKDEDGPRTNQEHDAQNDLVHDSGDGVEEEDALEHALSPERGGTPLAAEDSECEDEDGNLIRRKKNMSETNSHLFNSTNKNHRI